MLTKKRIRICNKGGSLEGNVLLKPPVPIKNNKNNLINLKDSLDFAKKILVKIPEKYINDFENIINLLEDDLEDNDGTDFFNLIEIRKNIEELLSSLKSYNSNSYSILTNDITDNILNKINNIIPEYCSECGKKNNFKNMHRDDDGYWICNQCYLELKNDSNANDNNNAHNINKSLEFHSKEEYEDWLKSEFNQLPCDIISSIAPSLRKKINWVEDYLNKINKKIIIPFSYSAENKFSNPLGINFDIKNNIPIVRDIDRNLLKKISDNKKLIQSYNNITGMVFEEFTDNDKNRYSVPNYTNDSEMTASEKMDWLISWIVKQPQPVLLKFSTIKNKCSRVQIENLQKIIDNVKKNKSFSLEDKLHLLWQYSDCAWILDPENPSDSNKRKKFKKCILKVLKNKFKDTDNYKKFEMDPFTAAVDQSFNLFSVSNIPITSQKIFLDTFIENIENILKEMMPKVKNKSKKKLNKEQNKNTNNTKKK